MTLKTILTSLPWLVLLQPSPCPAFRLWGPIGGARVGFIDGEYILNPTLDQMADTKLDLVVAGTNDAVLMVESEAQELDEATMLGAVMHGHKGFQPVIDAIISLAEPRGERTSRIPPCRTAANCSHRSKVLLKLM